MELTPQEIDAHRSRREIERRVTHSIASLKWDRMEARALKLHPPGQRQLPTVPRTVRQQEVQFSKSQLRRQPKLKKHILP